MEYILIVKQEANFQSRSLLFPAAEFLQVRKNEWEALCRDSSSATLDGVFVDRVFWEDYDVCGENIWKLRDNPHNKLIGKLSYCAEWGDEHLQDTKDAKWAANAVGNLCEGFNHVENYVRLRQQSPQAYQKLCGQSVKIVDGLLILERREDKPYAPPPFCTKEELHQWYARRERITSEKENLS